VQGCDRIFLRKKWARQGPFFFELSDASVALQESVAQRMADTWKVVETAAQDLGFELVDLERTAGGMLRVYIDTTVPDLAITIDDCEAMSRQLVHLLPVEGIDFERLEVSSPGLDRPLQRLEHYRRFAGLPVKLRLKVALSGRRNFEGTLRVSEQDALSLEYQGKDGEMLVLNFQIDEVDRARLIPQIRF